MVFSFTIFSSEREKKMKLLSVIVPCYNSEDYMRHCIDTLLQGGEEVEVLIINDGSTDQTQNIAEEYQQKYPTIVKVIYQENAGHGGALNKGISNAKGLYTKVVDSDDWVDWNAYKKILETLRGFQQTNTTVDLLLSNFVYEKEGDNTLTVMRYDDVFPVNQVFTWNDTKEFRLGQYIMMHSIIYRTQLLQDSNLKLPEHTFYVDNLYVYGPLLHVEKMYYLDVNFYRYFIGRDDQSVNEKVMIKQIDQQLKVNRLMIDFIDLQQVLDQKKRNYFFHHLEIVTAISSILLITSKTEENFQKKEYLWDYIREKDTELYKRLIRRTPGVFVNLPGKRIQNLPIQLYRLIRKNVGYI